MHHWDCFYSFWKFLWRVLRGHSEFRRRISYVVVAMEHEFGTRRRPSLFSGYLNSLGRSWLHLDFLFRKWLAEISYEKCFCALDSHLAMVPVAQRCSQARWYIIDDLMSFLVLPAHAPFFGSALSLIFKLGPTKESINFKCNHWNICMALQGK